MPAAPRVLAPDMRRTTLRAAITVMAVMVLAWRWWLIVSVGHEWDAGAYWWADPLDPYARAELNSSRAFLYSPAFAQAMAPLTALPWELFHAVWTTLNLAALVYLVGPIGGALASLLPPVGDELLIGNIHLLIAAALVAGFRHPVAWAFPLLTKVTPGIGVLWFAFRREWRKFGVAAAGSAAIVAISAVIDPELWWQWGSVLHGSTAVRVDVNLLPLPLAVKLVLAIIVVWLAARFDRRWLVPFGAFIALPVNWFPSLSILLASFPLLADDIRRRGREPNLSKAAEAR